MDKNFEKIKNSEGEAIKHKNYDMCSSKDDIDLFFTDIEFLDEINIERKQEIDELQTQYGIPDNIINQFKVISIEHKIRIYNILKYQVVKYFGVFNLMYKYYISLEKKQFNLVTGIDCILLKMEYNANTEVGRLVSDYGVPQTILEYYDLNYDINKKNTFDSYENRIFQKVDKIINNR